MMRAHSLLPGARVEQIRSAREQVAKTYEDMTISAAEFDQIKSKLVR